MLTRPSDNPFRTRFGWRRRSASSSRNLRRTPLDVRGDGVVVQDHVRGVHQLLPVLDVSRIARECVHDPELRQRQSHRRAVPCRLHLLAVDRQRTAPHDLGGIVRTAQGVDAPKQRRHPRRQMRQADILGEEVIRPQAQTRNGIQLAVARREEDDGQFGRECAQVAAQVEAALGLILERISMMARSGRCARKACMADLRFGYAFTP